MATQFDIGTLPRLSSSRLVDILAWEDDLSERVRLARREKPDFDAGALIPREVIDTWAILSGRNIQDFPIDFHEATQALTKVFRPGNR